ncbi:hypothetical protein ACGFS9_21880 [Streptomyces sp. NPDC048566]|uniref:hypothetical protein n=1 Tax=Streptomyces sp. NPDC048566 TaxID=3365569 RepID=UPI00371E317B
MTDRSPGNLSTYHFVLAPDGRAPEGSAPELAAVRLLSLLPPDWRYEPEFPGETVSLRLTPPPGTTEATAHTVFARTLTEPALTGWTWTNRP